LLSGTIPPEEAPAYPDRAIVARRIGPCHPGSPARGGARRAPGLMDWR